MFFLTRLLSCTANGAAPGGKREIPQGSPGNSSVLPGRLYDVQCAFPGGVSLYPADRKGRDYVRLHFQEKITAFY